MGGRHTIFPRNKSKVARYSDTCVTHTLCHRQIITSYIPKVGYPRYHAYGPSKTDSKKCRISFLKQPTTRTTRLHNGQPVWYSEAYLISGSGDVPHLNSRNIIQYSSLQRSNILTRAVFPVVGIHNAIFGYKSHIVTLLRFYWN